MLRLPVDVLIFPAEAILLGVLLRVMSVSFIYPLSK